MRRLFPSPATGLERPSGSTTPLSMPGLSIGSIRQEMSFGSNSRGLDIVQEGKTETGALSRWSFTNITPNSFHWLGESSASEDGSCWRGAGLLSEGFSVCRWNRQPSLQQISDADIDSDKAGEYQGNGKP